MGKRLIITDDNGLGRMIFFSVILIISFYFIWLLIFREVDNITIFVTSSILLIFIILIYRNILFSRKIIVNYERKLLYIKGLLFNKYNKKIHFDTIKSILFFEKEEMVADFGKHWQKSIKIIGLQNETIYEAKVSRIFNFQQLDELCNQYFSIDYIVEELDL